MQGSEEETVVYVVGFGGERQTWQHVYTAVTRGKQHVVVIARPSTLGWCIKNKPQRRFTSLGERLHTIVNRLEKV